jgi:dipeptidase E
MVDGRPIVIGLAGGTGSGKTTITEALLDNLGERGILLQHDWYYRDQADVSPDRRAEVNYDQPKAQESTLLVENIAALRQGQEIAAPQYDFATHTRARETRTISPRPVIVVEGINTLASEAIRACCDLTVFVDTPADVRFARRLQRDVKERGRTPASVCTQYLEHVRPMHDAFVEPCKCLADLVVSGEAEVTASVRQIVAWIEALRGSKLNAPNLLLLSNSTLPGEPYLRWAKPHIEDRLRGIDEALFIPYAAVDIGYETYTAMVTEGLSGSETAIRSIHTIEDKDGALARARCIIVGGGNSFSLLAACQREGLLAPIRASVRNGARYIGWSAGSNLACPTIKTTNDMPIEAPEGLAALGLVPFQINPHYTAATVEGHGGESRDQRLKEFVIRNPSLPVLGLPEGMLVSVVGDETTLVGEGAALWFREGGIAQPVSHGALR